MASKIQKREASGNETEAEKLERISAVFDVFNTGTGKDYKKFEVLDEVEMKELIKVNNPELTTDAQIEAELSELMKNCTRKCNVAELKTAFKEKAFNIEPMNVELSMMSKMELCPPNDKETDNEKKARISAVFDLFNTVKDKDYKGKEVLDESEMKMLIRKNNPDIIVEADVEAELNRLLAGSWDKKDRKLDVNELRMVFMKPANPFNLQAKK